MNKDSTSTTRPTFKKTLRRISMISVITTMTFIWLLLCFASVLTLKQYAQKNLELTGATMSHTLEATLVFNDPQAANETLATLGKQGQFAMADVYDRNNKQFAHWEWRPEGNTDTLGLLVSQWLFPVPVTQPIMHNGNLVGEICLTARDSLISHFIWMSFAVLTGCILFASAIALTITRSLHHGMVDEMQNITDVVHDVRTNRNFSRRVKEGRIEEFHRFGEDFNSLLDEMEEWQRQLQDKNAQLMRSAMHDPLTGLANRAAFRNNIATLMNDPVAKTHSALLFLDADNFKHINDTWGHNAGDSVLTEIASRMITFGGQRYHAYRLGGDEFAMVLSDVHSVQDVQRICTALAQQFDRSFDLHNGQRTSMSLSIGYALAWESNSLELFLENADRNMYQVKNKRNKTTS
ncbi:TPA: diguanylate cyclase DgcN [Kluyvera ascorbata]|uniref:diguanylate cyclase DgcN n=1 Tax=Kluyvera ascorbata TaxID=51288 RepID=UPI0019236CCF|nr:diguanylate cyclase DgcN [Kluyvera ascorbata]MDU3914319.1 diguanylate cyclase DgcN [Kluyvera ascorbata]HAT7517052.1 diguanylate cyclase DgcN [Kluyvera ascorbata]HCL5623688.1 diguanylate cyclase DgcN [Kluyvera ascorbata]HDG1665325.1 diguanylate cyclase DgcN [Kluyvera ascorbata]HDG1722697.1 diguanylate cyclase DgcN [Kluyvera ascorbata]